MYVIDERNTIKELLNVNRSKGSGFVVSRQGIGRAKSGDSEFSSH